MLRSGEYMFRSHSFRLWGFHISLSYSTAFAESGGLYRLTLGLVLMTVFGPCNMRTLASSLHCTCFYNLSMVLKRCVWNLSGLYASSDCHLEALPECNPLEWVCGGLLGLHDLAFTAKSGCSYPALSVLAACLHTGWVEC